MSASVVMICTATDLVALPCDPPCLHGSCVADHGNLSCSCESNWFGDSCTEFLCDVGDDVCDHGGICVQHPTNTSAALCVCPDGVFGDHCQYIVQSDMCYEQNCSDGGHCYGADDGYVCVCNENRYGVHCEHIGVDLCRGHLSDCFGNGNCSYDVLGNHVCTCNEYYESRFDCSDLIPHRNVCEAIPNPCHNESKCVATAPYQYRCDCPPDLIGENCSEAFDVCNGKCRNGGDCNVTANGHYFECSCPPGYTGLRCETPTSCDPTVECPCVNGGTLVPGSVCQCLPGYTGEHCEIRDRCGESPCSPHTRAPYCLNVAHLPGYVCVCADGWTGSHCQLEQAQCYDNNTATVSPVRCANSSCSQWANNDICDEQCNSRECGYDGWDCVPTPPNPWEACPRANSCRRLYQDDVCNSECNNAVCLYDGGDCSPTLEVCEEDCIGMVGDGQCQPQCSTASCPFDGQDCSRSSTTNFAKDMLVLILFSEPDRPFTSPWKEEFLMLLGRLLNSIPVINEVKVLSWQDLGAVPPPPDIDWLIYRVVMQLDIGPCEEGMYMCPQDAGDAVRWIHAAIASGNLNLGPYAVQSASTQPDTESSDSTLVYAMIGSGVALVVIAVAVAGVLLGKRRRVIAKIWRPTSPSEASPSTDGATTSGATNVSVAQSAMALESKEYMEVGSKKAKMFSGDAVQWEDSTVSTSAPSSSPATEPKEVAIGQRGVDSRQWGVVHTRDVGRLVLQFKRVNASNLGIDTAGPGGFTPLMLVVMRRPGVWSSINYQSRSSSESSSDDQTALIPTPRGTPRHLLVSPVDSTVSFLIEAKANLDAVNDYNQSALHLAAACSRPEYVDQLVEAGANPNIQDNWGQSSLHAAIGAGAEGAFMVLLNCSRIKYNLKSDGGITPLMAAVKMVNGFMVKQLLKKDSEIISSTDDEGRTAVHWAAMVDNIEALRMLVKCGAETIKDSQDSKGQTPLFLACREGSVMCVKHLIDCFANMTLLDNLEQSPLQVAMQKQHVDIVELLRASSHGPLYMHPHNGFPTDVAAYPPSAHTQLSAFASSKKRKPKTTNSAANGGHFSKFLPHQVSYPPSAGMPPSSSMSHLQQQPGESIGMSELQQASSSGTYGHQESPPTYPEPHSMVSHSPPLPPHCQPQNLYPSTSTHGHYSVATPTTSGYSEATPELPPSSVAHCNGTALHMMENYPVYPPTSADAGTRPLQHLPVVTEAEVQTPYGVGAPITPDSNPFVQGAYSPPHSGGSVSHASPQSAHHGASPNSGYGASPQSITPSPESQQQQMISAVGTVLHVEPGYNYSGHSMYPQHFMGSTPV